MRLYRLTVSILLLFIILVPLDAHAAGVATWTDRSVGGNTLYGVAYGGGLFVAVGDSGRIWSSPDGITWTDQGLQGSNTLYGVAYGGGLFVAVGNNGQIFSSTDGTTWTDQGTQGSNDLLGAAYGGGFFVAVGASGQIFSSTDGTTWTDQGSQGGNSLTGAAYSGGFFIAVGDSGTIFQSGSVISSSGSTASHTLMVYKTGAPPAGMGYVYSVPAGISCPGTCSATFADGTVVTLYAKNTNGMEFFRYEGDCADVPRSSPCVLTMDGYKEVPVRFYPPEPRLTWLKLNPETGIGEPVPFGDNTIDFTSDMLEGSCATVNIILHNDSNRSIDIGMIGGSDPLESPFAITDDSCSDTTLSFQSDCSIMIAYCPSNDGPYTDTFDLPTSDPNFPTQTIEVTGGN
mgnify:CR=1 FL=1